MDTNSANTLLETKEQYKEWLLNLPPGTFIGHACTYTCPLASFLSKKLNARWLVGSQWAWNNEGSQEPLTQWAHNHVHEIDYMGYREIRKEEALKILEEGI